MTDPDLLIVLAKGAAAGAWYGYLGWRTLGKGQPFNSPKFIRAVIWGTAIGTISAYNGLEISSFDAVLQQQLAELGLLAGLSATLDIVSLAIWRKIKPLLKKKEKPSA